MSPQVNLQNINVNLVPVDNMGDAREASQEESANTGGIALPGILFKQGQRYCLSTAIPVRRVRTRLEVVHAKERGNVADVKAATNRPLMKDHVGTISQYLRENAGGRYILPPMTLNVQQRRMSQHAHYVVTSTPQQVMASSVPPKPHGCAQRTCVNRTVLQRIKCA